MFFSVKSLTGRRIGPMIYRYAGFVVLLVILLLAGCVQVEDVGNLNGVLKDGYGSSFTINTSAKTIKRMEDATHVNYEGTIVNSPSVTALNGVLIIQFTKYNDVTYDSNPPYNITGVTENTGNKNKFAAVYWKDLTSNSVYMADAYVGYDHAIVGTLTEAQINFTMDRVGSYISWSIIAPYKK
jgi:hypothetical protein